MDEKVLKRVSEHAQYVETQLQNCSLFFTALQGSQNYHLADEEVEFSTQGNLQAAGVLVGGKHLYPHGHADGSAFQFHLHQFGLGTLNDSQGDVAERADVTRHGVLGEFHLAYVVAQLLELLGGWALVGRNLGVDEFLETGIIHPFLEHLQ